MNIQISIIGIGLILIFYALSTAILVLLWKWIDSRWLKWGTTGILAVLFLAAPIADEAWVTWKFNLFCKDAGIHVVRTVEADGYFDGTTTGWSRPDTVTNTKVTAEYERAGYRFRERNTSASGADPGKISHLEKYPDGSWRISILEHPTARYHYKRVYEDQDAGYLIRKTKYVLIDSINEEVLGWRMIVKRYPGWIDRLWIGFFGTGMTMCPDPEHDVSKSTLPQLVLIPVRK